jgi:hypothetical protein
MTGQRVLAGLTATAAAAASALTLGSGSADAASLWHITLSTPSATMRSGPGSYVIGNVYTGWQFARDGDDGGSWSFGQASLGGNKYCGWLETEHLSGPTGSDGTNYCGAAAKIPLTRFASLVNSNSATNGAATSTTCASTPEFGNTRPVDNTDTNGVDQIGTLGSGVAVAWRYVTLDGHYAMVHVTGEDSANNGWIFVPRGCLPPTLPYAEPAADK